MMNPLIIKLGGVLLDSEEALERLFSALVNYRESHQRPLVIVHGGGCVVDELMKDGKIAFLQDYTARKREEDVRFERGNDAGHAL